MTDNIPKTDRTRGNIRKLLQTTLEDRYGKGEATLELLRAHGIDPKNIDFITSVESNMLNTMEGKTINDSSIDDNSNKSLVTTESLIQEGLNPFRKLLGYDLLYREMKKLYGKEYANELASQMYDYSLAMHDSTKIDRVYCWAMSSVSLLTSGRQLTRLESAPAKRIQSYIATLCGTIHTLSGSGIAGACAVSDFFLCMSKLAMDEGITFCKLDEDKQTQKYLENYFQQFVYDMNDITRVSFESPFTNLSIFDRPKLYTMVEDLFWLFAPDYQDTNDIHGAIKQEIKDEIVSYVIRMQELFLEYFQKGDVLKGGLPYTFPVVTLNLSKNDDETDIVDKEYLDYICGLDISRFNIFASKGSRVASCCRLLSDNDLLQVAGQSNSFGGVGSNLGSHRVVTINLPRVAILSDNLVLFYEYLKEKIIKTADILKAHKALITNTTKCGLQPFIETGIIDPSRLFSTTGLVGIYECAEIMSGKTGLDIEIVINDMLVFINETVINYGKEQGLLPNIEAVPAESLAVKLAKVDKELFGEKKQPYPMYSNQFIPLWSDASVLDRMKMDGKFNKLLTGGGICHASIASKLSSIQTRKLIEHAVKSGCEHFALNGVYSLCEDNHTSLGDYNKCPVCGSEQIRKFTRVVGFMTEVSSWNKTRREWEFPRRGFSDMDVLKDNK